MQDTLGEWSRSDAAESGRDCLDCHMPWVADTDTDGRHRDHNFVGMLDADLLGRAVEVEIEARREGGTVIVEATLRGAAIGHAFPTGDLFREAVLRVWTIERESDMDLRRMYRRFETVASVDQEGRPRDLSVEVEDSRVPPPGQGERRFELRLRSPAAQRVGWSLELEAHSSTRGDDPPHTPVAQGEVPIESR